MTWTCPPVNPAELRTFDDEAELVRRAQAGERDALVTLVEREYARVYTLAIAVLRCPADAADATQETLVHLLRSLHTFRSDDGATLSTWLHRLTVNVCVDALRRQQRAAARRNRRARAACLTRQDLEGSRAVAGKVGQRLWKPFATRSRLAEGDRPRARHAPAPERKRSAQSRTARGRQSSSSCVASSAGAREASARPPRRCSGGRTGRTTTRPPQRAARAADACPQLRRASGSAGAALEAGRGWDARRRVPPWRARP